MGATCENNCAPLSWDVVTPQILWGTVSWAMMLLGGVSLAIASKTSNVDETKVMLNRWKTQIQSSTGYCVAVMLLCLLQCIIFCARTYNLSATTLELVLELMACLTYSVEVVVTWAHENLCGIKQGISFTCFSSQALVLAFVVPSVVLLMVTEVDGQKGWFTFSFLPSVRILACWAQFCELSHLNTQAMKWQVINVTISTLCMIFFAATTMMTLENLGDPEFLEKHNADEWSVLSSFYYVFVTISTVGYGDMSPATGLGRIFAIIAIMGGIASFSVAINQVIEVFRLKKLGRGAFQPTSKRCRHIVVTGNPSAQMVKDFISELFHPDHSDDAEDLEVVFLFPSRNSTMEQIQDYLKLRSMIDIAPRIHVLQGSVLDQTDMQRIKAIDAATFFVMPNMFAQDLVQEDSENVVRVLAIRRAVPMVRVVVLLTKAENRQLLIEQGQIQNRFLLCIAVDQFKLELVGKTCQVPGFASLICNLCKTIGDCESEDDPGWQMEYDQGLGNELYEVELSNTYANKKATFGEAVLDILEQTEGKVYLIGLIETLADDDNAEKKVLINPGPTYKVKPVSSGMRTFGVFISPDREAIVQCEEGQVFLGRKDRPNNDEAMLDVPRDSPEWSGENPEPEPSNEDEISQEQAVGMGMSETQQQCVRKLMKLTDLQKEGSNPTGPPLEILAKGGHIILISVGAKGSDELRLGGIHFIRPLRGRDPGRDKIVPIVVMAPVLPKDWHTVAGFKEVYFMQGSPLSLFDLERVNFRAAQTIFINHSGGGSGIHTDPYMVDSEAIFCSRLIESHIGSAVSGPEVIAELTFDLNYHFIPLPGANATAMSRLQQQLSSLEQDSQNGASAAKDLAVAASSVSEYFRQPRFACGRLFVSNVVTSLVVNTFYNSSLAQLVGAMVSAQISTVTVPREWEGKSYMEYFDYLLWEKQLMAIGIFRRAQGALVEAKSPKKSGGEASNVLARAVTRKMSSSFGEGIQKKLSFITARAEKAKAPPNIPPQSYVYCAPPAKEASMNPMDRILCFGVCQLDLEKSTISHGRVRSSFMDPTESQGVIKPYGS